MLKIIIVRVLVELRAKKVTITRRVLTMVVQEALLAKNSGANVDGKTPFQRLVGSNPRTRGLLESDLGMLAGARESLRIEIRGLSRKHLILADLDKRCRLAMAGYARAPQSLWPRGCAVHVQRGTHPIADPGSSGIGRVCGQDGSNVLIRFGGQYVRANPRFVRLAIGDGPGEPIRSTGPPPSDPDADADPDLVGGGGDGDGPDDLVAFQSGGGLFWSLAGDDVPPPRGSPGEDGAEDHPTIAKGAAPPPASKAPGNAPGADVEVGDAALFGEQPGGPNVDAALEGVGVDEDFPVALDDDYFSANHLRT